MAVANGDWAELHFEALPKDRSYTLRVQTGDGAAATLFEDGPFAQLSAQSDEVPHDAGPREMGDPPEDALG